MGLSVTFESFISALDVFQFQKVLQVRIFVMENKILLGNWKKTGKSFKESLKFIRKKGRNEFEIFLSVLLFNIYLMLLNVVF